MRNPKRNSIFVFMKNVIDLFSELGARLRGFGADDATQAVMEAACRANGWFTPADVRRAVLSGLDAGAGSGGDRRGYAEP